MFCPPSSRSRKSPRGSWSVLLRHPSLSPLSVALPFGLQTFSCWTCEGCSSPSSPHSFHSLLDHVHVGFQWLCFLKEASQGTKGGAQGSDTGPSCAHHQNSTQLPSIVPLFQDTPFLPPICSSGMPLITLITQSSFKRFIFSPIFVTPLVISSMDVGLNLP